MTLVAFGVVVALLSCGVEGTSVLSDARAIDLARQACTNRVAIPPGVVPAVERSGDRVVVTFPTTLAPGTRGADYHARVTLDAASGRVIEILGGD